MTPDAQCHLSVVLCGYSRITTVRYGNGIDIDVKETKQCLELAINSGQPSGTKLFRKQPILAGEKRREKRHVTTKNLSIPQHFKKGGKSSAPSDFQSFCAKTNVAMPSLLGCA